MAVTISVHGILKRGQGKPLTLFVPGGNGEHLADRMSYADRVKGTKVGFAYEQSGYAESIMRIRRQADRDAAEVLALASEHKAPRAIGFSRGARAILGSLAEDSGAFERIVLVIPPRGITAGSGCLGLNLWPNGTHTPASRARFSSLPTRSTPAIRYTLLNSGRSSWAPVLKSFRGVRRIRIRIA